MKTVVNTEEKIAHQAFDALHSHTGLSIELLDVNSVLGTGVWPDMRLRIASTTIELISEIKCGDLAHDNIVPVVKQLKAAADGRAAMLIASNVGAAAGQALRELGINYLDANGNAYINMPPFFVFIEGRQNNDNGHRNKPIKPYSHADLQVIFALLANPGLLNANYGDIAAHSNVALGVCGAVFRDLKDQGYFVESLAGKKREWRAKHKLLGQWVAQYPLLRKKHYIGCYRPASSSWWKAEALDQHGAVLGGKHAVAAYSGNSDCHFNSVHIDDGQQWPFIRAMRFDKIETNAHEASGPALVRVYSKFWGAQAELESAQRITHPLINYADLIDEGSAPSIAAANDILSKYLV